MQKYCPDEAAMATRRTDEQTTVKQSHDRKLGKNQRQPFSPPDATSIASLQGHERTKDRDHPYAR